MGGRGQNPGSNGASPNSSMYQQHSRAEAAQAPVCWGVQMHRACSARTVSVSSSMKKKMVSREDREAYFITLRKLLQDCLSDWFYGTTAAFHGDRSNASSKLVIAEKSM